GISRDTVRSATLIPTFKSSPWILGAPHRGLAAAIRQRERGFQGYRRETHDGAPGQPGPVVAEPSPLPTQDGVRGDDDQRLLPASPQPGQRDPKEPVATAQPR